MRSFSHLCLKHGSGWRLSHFYFACWLRSCRPRRTRKKPYTSPFARSKPALILSASKTVTRSAFAKIFLSPSSPTTGWRGRCGLPHRWSKKFRKARRAARVSPSASSQAFFSPMMRSSKEKNASWSPPTWNMRSNASVIRRCAVPTPGCSRKRLSGSMNTSRN